MKRAVLPLLTIAIGLSACTSFRPTDPAALTGLPPKAEVESVPFYPQEENYCGPAALATVLSWSGRAASQRAVAEKVFTAGRDGTFRSDMLSGARRYGRLAVPISNLHDLLREIAAGHPVIVFQNKGLSWWPVWHYAVAVGYDLGNRSIVLRSGKTKRKVMGFTRFERTWHRGEYWALVVLPPDRLPATSDEWDVLRAAAGLERTANDETAITAYREILRRWPDNWAAAFGLGNAHFSQDAYEAAEKAFRRAVSINPKAHEAWNNLALALLRQGEKTEALAAVRRARRLADDGAQAYTDTLDKIQAHDP